MLWQLKLFAVALVLVPICCEALLEDAFDSDVELLAEETDLQAANARAPRAAGYFYAQNAYPSFYSPPGPKAYLPPPRYGQQYGSYGGYGGYDNSCEDDYDYDVPKHHHQNQHHHHHHRDGSHRQVSPNKGFQNNANNGRPLQGPNTFIPPNNGISNPFLLPNNGVPRQMPNRFIPSNIDRPPVTLPSQATPVVQPTPSPIDLPTQVVAIPPTPTSVPVTSSTDEGDPFNIDIRFGN